MPRVAVEELTGDYVLDCGRTRLGFVARHAMVTRVHGHFGRFCGRAHIDQADASRNRWRSSSRRGA
jgi:polyisoprenoid-binding protein YceI